MARRLPTTGRRISGTPIAASTTISEEAPRPYSKEEVQALIRHYAAGYGIEATRPLRIAACESGFRFDARNNKSTASGVFQYLNGTWANTPAGRAGRSVFDAEANVHMAIAAIANGGIHHWNASRHCWERT